jgi:hypothetical protein
MSDGQLLVGPNRVKLWDVLNGITKVRKLRARMKIFFLITNFLHKPQLFFPISKVIQQWSFVIRGKATVGQEVNEIVLLIFLLG